MVRSPPTENQSARNPCGIPPGLKRGGSPGRPKGVPNRVTTDARAGCTQLVDDRVYRARLLDDRAERKVAPTNRMPALVRY